jgi:hypothetical protein
MVESRASVAASSAKPLLAATSTSAAALRRYGRGARRVEQHPQARLGVWSGFEPPCGRQPAERGQRRQRGGVEHRERQLRRGSAHGGGEAAHLGIVAVLGDYAQPRTAARQPRHLREQRQEGRGAPVAHAVVRRLELRRVLTRHAHAPTV